VHAWAAAAFDTSSSVQTETAAPSIPGQEDPVTAVTVMAHSGQASAPHGLGVAARALMPQDRAAFHDLVVRAWQDPQLRDDLGAAARQYLPSNPAGFLGAVNVLLHPSPGGTVPPPGVLESPDDPE